MVSRYVLIKKIEKTPKSLDDEFDFDIVGLIVVVGGGFSGSISRDVSVCEYIERDDKRSSFLHNATG